MITRRILILRRVEQLLKAGGHLPSSSVYRCRGESLFDETLPAVDINWRESIPQSLGGGAKGATRHDLVVRVDTLVRQGADNSVPIDEIADEIAAKNHELIMADPTLAGLAAGIFEGPSRAEMTLASGALWKVEQVFTVVHATRAHDLTQTF